MVFQVISFYRYTPLEDPLSLRETLRTLCKRHQIVGRILIATEGINGAVSGLASDINTLKSFLCSTFEGLTFRERPAPSQAYHKLVVRIRKEICTFDTPIDVNKKGAYVEASELKRMYDDEEDFFILDARNEYEAKVGKFKNAHVLPIETFRQFADATQTLDVDKEKKIVMYCTGGIRCEKASAYMKSRGYKNVHHLKGGIINYLNNYPSEHYEGGCFVFDDRLLDQADKPITHCVHCSKPSAHMTNCHSVECGRLYITCDACKETTKTTCSAECTRNPNQRPQRRADPIIGHVKNYYPKAKAALVQLHKPLQKGWTLNIRGRVSNVICDVNELRDYDENEIDCGHADQLITIPVQSKVRKRDAVRLMYAPVH